MSTLSTVLNSDNTITHSKEGYKLLTINIEHMLRIPFSQSMFLQYSKSLNQAQKAEIIRILKIDLAKKWTDILFIKKLSVAIKKITSDTTMMKQILMLLNQSAIQPELSLDNYQSHLQQHVQNYGQWPVYWSVYYHSQRLSSETDVLTLLDKLQQLMNKKTYDSKEVTLSQVGSLYDPTAHKLQQIKLDKKVALLETKATKEAQLRMQMEQELAKLDKQNRSFKYEVEKQVQSYNQLKQQFNEALQQLKKQDQHIESLLIKKREEEDRWLQERLLLLQQQRRLSEDVKKQQQLKEQITSQLDEAKKQITSLTQSQNQLLQKQKENPRLEQETTEKLIHALQYKLHKRLSQANQNLLNNLTSHGTASSFEEKQQQLNFLKDTITLIEQTEQYLNIDNNFQTSTHHIVKHEDFLQQQSPTPTADELGSYGTFFRRDHGGYVELESGERFNITESLVHQLELQHEAEVLCIPNQVQGKSAHYTIQILFQGDDAYSPITSYDGYVYSDSDGKWFCIDMNDETRKFPIHFKDIDIQKPSHGDPCTFNVANDGHIARLTKLYRLLPGETYETTFTAKKAEKNKTNVTQANKEKPAPYLKGCTITIIGGQRKWFESVVKETGAELVHNGGEKPERISADLARSQALFMILTSTSHRATWEGIEIAKANQIPHFTIQGSKSNFRSILWENQQLIRETNRDI